MTARFADVSVGDTHVTGGRTIAEADLVNFAGVSGDFNALHTDATTMEDSAFGERIAHGALVFAIATGLLWQSRTPAEREALLAFYGVDELRFPASALVGETIHVETEVLEKAPREHPEAAGVVRYGTTVATAEGKTVLSCELLALLR